VRIWRESAFSGAINYMDLDIIPEAYETWANGQGPLIQDAFPNLTASEREFLMTGVTPAEWENLFGTENTES